MINGSQLVEYFLVNYWKVDANYIITVSSLSKSLKSYSHDKFAKRKIIYLNKKIFTSWRV